MTRSIVKQAVTAQEDMRLAECESADLEGAVSRCTPDVLIVEESADRSEAFYRGLFVAHPLLKICILTEDGRSATFLRIRRVRLADASPTTLIETVRYESQREAMPGRQ
jgi:hypothetical protein